jgi:hypothetical protein
MGEIAIEWVLGVLVVVILLASGGLGAFRWWRKKQEEDENTGRLYDLAEMILASIKEASKGALGAVPEAVVRESAGRAYDKLVAGTPLESFVTRELFISAVVSQWREMCDIEVLTTTVYLQLAGSASGPPSG